MSEKLIFDKFEGADFKLSHTTKSVTDLRFLEYENEARDISCNVCVLLIPPLSFLCMSSKFIYRFHQEACQNSAHVKQFNTGQSRSFTEKKCR